VNTPDTLSDIQRSLWLIKPELFLAATFLVLIITGLFKRIPRTITPVIFALGMMCTLLAVLGDFGTRESLFANALTKTAGGDSLKLIIDIASLLTCILAATASALQARSQLYALLTAITLGCHFLVMSNDMAVTFISLELISLPSYVLAGFSFNKHSAEASLKYFIYGAVASAIMVYGFSLIYGLTGTTQLRSVSSIVPLSEGQLPVMLIATLMVLLAVLFKIAAVPMHMWAPDVYQTAPTSVVAYLSTAPKIAGVGFLIIFVSAMKNVALDWQFIVSLVSVVTITLGNIVALTQQNVKRLMAYSSIAQSGFLLANCSIFTEQLWPLLLFYASAYTVANFLVFYYISQFEKLGLVTVQDFGGSARQFLWPMVFLLVGFISLTGLPPTAGFTAKLLLFSGLWQSFEGTAKGILLVLFAAGLVNTVVSLFYYLRIPYYAFLKEREPLQKQNFLIGQNLFALAMVVVLLALFFAPAVLMSWINKVNFVF
jgi:NADH-quinone oxidoreductase subunit N